MDERIPPNFIARKSSQIYVQQKNARKTKKPHIIEYRGSLNDSIK